MAQQPTPPAYVPALDGVRAVSILLVVLSHLGLGRLVPGAFGVTLFFFISGYLITRQLVAAEKPDFAGFYLRRALRLLPASTAYIAIAGLAYGLAGGAIPAAGWAAALLYGANYYDLWAHYGPTLPGVRHPFNILWSLAIEEHFYLLWPLVLAVLRKRGRVAACWVVCAAVPLWRLWLLHHCFGPDTAWVCGPENPDPQWRYNRLYLATDTRVDSIAWGALLALLGDARQGVFRGARWWDVKDIPPYGVLLLVLGFAWPDALGRYVMRPSLQGAALLLLVPWLLRADFPMLSGRPAVALGRLSYSLYLWHWGALGVADYVAGRHLVAWLAIAVPLSGVLALVSYHAIERPMLRLRRRAGSHTPLTGDVPSVAERQTSSGQEPHAAS